MPQLKSCTLLLCALPLAAQTVVDSSASQQLTLAAHDLDRIADLVQAGALPQIRLEDARQQLADANDNVVLARTLYGTATAATLTEPDAAEMVDAAQHRVDREQARIADAQKLIDAGIAARNSLDALNLEMAQRQTTLQLAQSRARLVQTLASVAQTESAALAAYSGPRPFDGIEEHFAGKGSLSKRDLRAIKIAYIQQFQHPMPISANGETAVHRALGFDHRGRVDVAVNPDQPEGQWLRQFLESKNIPFYAFRAAIRGKATGAHIHIGPGSTRLRRPAALDAD
jgi:hypothetical protein